MHFIPTVFTIQTPDYHQLGELRGVAGGQPGVSFGVKRLVTPDDPRP
jgi:hypothetical protein